MPSNAVKIHKLQHALNTKGMRITYSTTQFYSADQDRPVTLYSVKQAIWDEERGKYANQELFKAANQLQIILFLRDLWYIVNGKELPKADKQWEDTRKTINIFSSQEKGE